MSYSIEILETAIEQCGEEIWNCEQGLKRPDHSGNHERYNSSIKHNVAAIADMRQTIEFIEDI